MYFYVKAPCSHRKCENHIIISPKFEKFGGIVFLVVPPPPSSPPSPRRRMTTLVQARICKFREYYVFGCAAAVSAISAISAVFAATVAARKRLYRPEFENFGGTMFLVAPPPSPPSSAPPPPHDNTCTGQNLKISGVLCFLLRRHHRLRRLRMSTLVYVQVITLSQIHQSNSY